MAGNVTNPVKRQGPFHWARRVIHFPANGLIGLISLYRRTLSPLLPVFLGPGCGCRFAPSCAGYAMEAIQTHGALYGVGLTAIRLLKCMPFHPGGFDPVPAKRSKRAPRCEAVVSASAATRRGVAPI